jgi:competence protein ComEC
MNRKKQLNWLPVVILVWALIMVVLVFKKWPDLDLHLVFCDVGQGDAILINYQDKQVLVDGGLAENSGRLLSCLSSQMPFWDRRLEVVVNTHPDEDHFGGLIEIVKRYRIDNYLHNGYGNSQSQKFKEFKKILIDKKICSKIIPADDGFSIDKLYFERLFINLEENQASDSLQQKFFDGKEGCGLPEFKKQTDNLNNSSIVLQLKFGQFDALLTGDIESEIEKILVWREEIEPVEILKIAHHGSKTSTSQEILSAARPQLAVISVGENSFGHPAKEALERLQNNNIQYLRTDQQGTIEIVSNGQKWWRKE